MVHVLLLNAPPRAGKDTFAKVLAEIYDQVGYVEILKFAKPLKEAAHRIFGFEVAHDYFEEVKDIPQTYLGGRSWRQVYIWLSEEVVKPNFGKDHWGKAAVQQIEEAMMRRADARPHWAACRSLVIFADSGFLDETLPVFKAFKKTTTQVIVKRPGCTFAGDSRSYWRHKNIPMTSVNNVGEISDLKRKGERLLQRLGIL